MQLVEVDSCFAFSQHLNTTEENDKLRQAVNARNTRQFRVPAAGLPIIELPILGCDIQYSGKQ